MGEVIETYQDSMCKKRDPVITAIRRKELFAYANRMADEIGKVLPHERHLLRRMVDLLLDGDY